MLLVQLGAVIRTSLLSGKLSQNTRTLHVIRATSRTFERPQWELLASRLSAWKAGLEGVLEVVESARKKNESFAAKAAEKKEKEKAKEELKEEAGDGSNVEGVAEVAVNA